MSTSENTSELASGNEQESSFPSLQARTGRFRFGMPGSFVGNEDGTAFAFIRSRSGKDARGCVWLAQLDAEGELVERVIVDVAHPGGAAEDDVPEAEKARRERLRESGSGVTAFSANSDLTLFVFALGGSLFAAETAPGADGEFAIRRLEVPGPVVDPRLSPAGKQVAWVADNTLYAAPVTGGSVREVARASGEDKTVGLANFLAAEEFGRFRGFWWSPDSAQLLVEEVDSSGVEQWQTGDPDNPDGNTRSIRYPAAGTANPQVELAIYSVTDGIDSRIPVDLPAGFDYITHVSWSTETGPLVTVLNREQTDCQVVQVNPETGATAPQAHLHDDNWVEPVAGTPLALSAGQLVASGDQDARDSLVVEGQEVDLDGWLVRTVYGAVTINDRKHLALGVNRDPSENQIGLVDLEGNLPLNVITNHEGWHSISLLGGNRAVMSYSTLDSFETSFTYGQLTDAGFEALGSIGNTVLTPPLRLNVERHVVGPNKLSAVIQWPTGHVPGSRRLPVIMNPYGGPHSQRVVQSGRAFAETQWLADQGFCVIVADVRGATGRSEAEQRTFYRNLTDGPLNDQIEVLEWAAVKWPQDIDPKRVGIMGWSFGGYLSALAVMKRPDKFSAAIAGAPVTNWQLYDTAYTERYLGNPHEDAAPYDESNLIPLAPHLERPLLIIHGLSDDNVFARHSLDLCAALTAANKPHTFVPLENITHMASDPAVATNLLALQLDFFLSNL